MLNKGILIVGTRHRSIRCHIPVRVAKKMRSATVQKRLKIALVLVFFVMCVEVAGGIMAHSLALLSDAAHMLTDAFALSLSLMALTIAAQPSTHTKTFGYHRVEILAALANGILLLLMALGILWEAYRRFTNPQEVHSLIVISAALVGLILTSCHPDRSAVYRLVRLVEDRKHGSRDALTREIMEPSFSDQSPTTAAATDQLDHPNPAFSGQFGECEFSADSSKW